MKSWFIAFTLDVNKPNIVKLVSGLYDAYLPLEVYYSEPPKAGPFTTKFSEATLFKTRDQAESFAFSHLVAKNPDLLGKLRVERITRRAVREMVKLSRLRKQERRYQNVLRSRYERHQ